MLFLFAAKSRISCRFLHGSREGLDKWDFDPFSDLAFPRKSPLCVDINSFGR
jgi:hypothetical protein